MRDRERDRKGRVRERERERYGSVCVYEREIARDSKRERQRNSKNSVQGKVFTTFLPVH